MNPTSLLPPHRAASLVADPSRRHFLRAGQASLALVALAAAGVLRPGRVIASELPPWQRPAFTAHSFNEALKAWGAADSTASPEIIFRAPEIAENGAQVVVDVESRLAGSQSIAVFAEKNPMPLVASVRFHAAALPQLRLPLKLAETMRVRAVVKTDDGRVFHAERKIGVTLGGCAG